MTNDSSIGRMGRRGMVASPHYLATGAGLAVLRRGGNAVDAAIACNAVLAVVMPYLCGIGGDLFALLYVDGQLAGLNGSGRAGKEASAERVRQLAGENRMPQGGPLTVTVPGCVEAWGTLHDRYGRLPFPELLADAITYARDGFPVTADFARAIAASEPFLHPDTPARDTFLPDGRPPTAGQMLAQPRLARTLQTIAAEGPRAYYRGSIAQELVHSLRQVGGLLSIEDLDEHHSDWVEPLSLVYRDVTVYELPPNSQGVVALLMLGILQNLPERDLQQGGARYLHLLAEAARLAYLDRDAHLTDPEHMAIAPEELLAPAHLQELAQKISGRASHAATGAGGDTIYLCTADGEGNLVSLIESNYSGIGSGVMAGETGIMLQNRGAWFSLDREHVNVIGPRKRTMHTLMPGMAFRNQKPWLVFGTMGGSTQPQIHVELLTRLIDQGMRPQEAIAAPRFDAVVGTGEDGKPALQLEDRFPPEVVAELRAWGHDVQLLPPYTSAMGHAHAIEIEENGVYVGAADPRTTSLALGY